MGLDGDLRELIDQIKESITKLQNAVKMLSLGFDYKKIVRFRLFTPRIFRYGNDRVDFERRGWKPNELPTKDGDEFCINFVIESALKLQEFDFDIVNRKKDSSLDQFY